MTYNYTSQNIISKNRVDYWFINATEERVVFESRNAADAIQYAFNQNSFVSFQYANYTITHTIWINSKGIDGTGTWFILPSDFESDFAIGIPQNITHATVRNVHLDETRWTP